MCAPEVKSGRSDGPPKTDAQSENVLSGFADAGAVSDYARAALAWAVKNGIVYGRDDHRIDPRGTATRAECAALLWRFVSQYSLA